MSKNIFAAMGPFKDDILSFIADSLYMLSVFSIEYVGLWIKTILECVLLILSQINILVQFLCILCRATLHYYPVDGLYLLILLVWLIRHQ